MKKLVATVAALAFAASLTACGEAGEKAAEETAEAAERQDVRRRAEAVQPQVPPLAGQHQRGDFAAIAEQEFHATAFLAVTPNQRSCRQVCRRRRARCASTPQKLRHAFVPASRRLSARHIIKAHVVGPWAGRSRTQMSRRRRNPLRAHLGTLKEVPRAINRAEALPPP